MIDLEKTSIMEKTNTKEKIQRVAAKMFSERGFNKVSTREIAKAAGVNSALIYYYFYSKEDILKSLYKFYAEERTKERPDLDELLRLVEIAPPHEVFERSQYCCNEENREFLNNILFVAVKELSSDPESERFIKEYVFDDITYILKPLLQRMIDLGKVKPFDVEAFINLVFFYCFSAIALNNSSLRKTTPDYYSGLSYIYSLIVQVKE